MPVKYSALIIRPLTFTSLVVTPGERMDEDIMVFPRQACFKHDSVNFVYKVAYWYDGTETTNKKQVFRENTFRENIRYIITSLSPLHK